ncbi:tat pathway signal sequence [Gordonia sp. CPCC 205515]|uniref:tat pathway signal sequence n=1 Tax=Gordonia sp. CPCC 205515 TaxID=3140791 RepID=UPI003AF38247
MRFSRFRRSMTLVAAVAAVGAGVIAPSTDAHAAPFGDDALAAALPARLAAASAYAATRPGTTGIVVTDRRTGITLVNNFADTPVWTASTIKLAIAADLLNRNRVGRIHLSAADRGAMHRMLNSSDGAATDQLWFKYAGADHLAYNNAFRGFGMTALAPQRGFTAYYPYWGFQKDTPRDLGNLVTSVLRMPAADRNYLVGEMRGVAANQRWGIMALPGSLRPGNKNGWSDEQGGSVVNTVGFAGNGERFVVSIMNSLRGQGNQADGKATVSRVARDLLA